MLCCYISAVNFKEISNNAVFVPKAGLRRRGLGTFSGSFIDAEIRIWRADPVLYGEVGQTEGEDLLAGG